MVITMNVESYILLLVLAVTVLRTLLVSVPVPLRVTVVGMPRV